MASFESLPNEIYLQIFTALLSATVQRPETPSAKTGFEGWRFCPAMGNELQITHRQHLSPLLRTCRRFYCLLSPLLYTNIRFMEGSNILAVSPAAQARLVHAQDQLLDCLASSTYLGQHIQSVLGALHSPKATTDLTSLFFLPRIECLEISQFTQDNTSYYPSPKRERTSIVKRLRLLHYVLERSLIELLRWPVGLETLHCELVQFETMDYDGWAVENEIEFTILTEALLLQKDTLKELTLTRPKFGYAGINFDPPLDLSTTSIQALRIFHAFLSFQHPRYKLHRRLPRSLQILETYQHTDNSMLGFEYFELVEQWPLELAQNKAVYLPNLEAINIFSLELDLAMRDEAKVELPQSSLQPFKEAGITITVTMGCLFDHQKFQ